MQPELSEAERANLERSIERDVAAIAKDVLAGVPKRFQPLIPTELTPVQQLAWYVNARSTGVFDKPAVPPTDGGARPAITPKAPDLSSLPVYARLAAGYSK